MGHASRKHSQDTTHGNLLGVMVLSLGLHLLAYGGLKWGRFFDTPRSAEKNPEQETILHVTLEPPLPKKVIPPPPPKPRPKPKTLVEVPPDLATAKKPKDPKFYSDKNAQAANPESSKDTKAKPKLKGEQPIVPKLENTAKPSTQPPQPKPSPPKPPPTQPKPTTPKPPNKPVPSKPKEAPPVQVAKAIPTPPVTPAATKPSTSTPAKPQPTRAEALKALPKNSSAIPGRTLDQEGGVKRVGKPSFDVQLTGYGSYDLKLTAAISKRWHQLLRIHNAPPGQVVLEFDLFANGTVRNVRLIRNTVGPLHTFVCEHAVTDPSPFDVWSTDMQREIGSDRKHCRITFSYIPR